MEPRTEIPLDQTDWFACPKCGDTRITAGPAEVDGLDAWQDVECVCGHRWTEVYKAAFRVIFAEENS